MLGVDFDENKYPPTAPVIIVPGSRRTPFTWTPSLHGHELDVS